MSCRTTIELVRTDEGWHGRLKGGNGQTVWSTGSYTRRTGAMRAVRLLGETFGVKVEIDSVTAVDERHPAWRCRIALSLRFWSKVQVGQPDECWPWRAGKNREGYGRFGVGWVLGGPSIWGAHRVAWVLTNGLIAEDTELDHVCHTRDTSCVQGSECPHRSCVNPRHLEPVTHQENAARRSIRLTKFKCGHPFSERVRNGAGGRCGACAREKESARYYRNRPTSVRSRS